MAIPMLKKALDFTTYDPLERAHRLHDLGARYGRRYRETGAVNDLEQANQLFQEALDLKLHDYPARTSLIEDLNTVQRDKHFETHVLTRFEETARRCEETLNLTPQDHPDRVHRLYDLSISYRDRYYRTGNLTDLSRSIEKCEEVLDLTPPHHPDRARRLQELSTRFKDRYKRTGSLGSLNSAILYNQKALDLTSHEHSDQSYLLQYSGGLYRERYSKTDAIADSTKAIDRLQEALDLTPHDHLDRARQLHDLGTVYEIRYELMGNLTDFEMAVQWYQDALKLMPHDHSSRTYFLQDLGNVYRHKHFETGASTDFEETIRWYEAALKTTTLHDRSYRVCLFYYLGFVYSDRYQETGALMDLDMTIRRYQDALDLMPYEPNQSRQFYEFCIEQRDKCQQFDHKLIIQRYQENLDLKPRDYPTRARILQQLGIGYSDKYRQAGALSNLDQAIWCFGKALDITPYDKSVPNEAHLSDLLARACYEKEQKIVTDLEAAIQQDRKVLDSMLYDDPVRAERFHSLFASYSDKYLETEALADLESAIVYGQKALEIIPSDYSNRTNLFQVLSVRHRDRFFEKGALIDLGEAIGLLKDALSTAAIQNCCDRAHLLQDLGNAYQTRATQTDNEADVQDAIRTLQEALDLTLYDDTNQVYLLYDLGVGYQVRHDQTWALTDIEEAIGLFEEALHMTPRNHPNKARLLRDLGVAYRQRYERTGVLADLEDAVRQLREALEITPQDVRDQMHLLQNLGVSHRDRYRQRLHCRYGRQGILLSLCITYRTSYHRTGDIRDLNIAIEYGEEALTDPVGSHNPYRVHILQSLGDAYQSRGARTGALPDLEMAIRLYQEAPDDTTISASFRKDRLCHIGNGYSSKYRRTGAMDDLKEALQQFSKALEIKSYNLPVEIHLLQYLGTAYSQSYQQTGAPADLEEAIRRFREALSIIPHDHPGRVNVLISLGAEYANTYRQKRVPADFEEANRLLMEALNIIPDDHPERGRLLLNLGTVYSDRYREDEILADRQEAIQRLQEVFSHKPSDLQIRLTSGCELFAVYVKAQDWAAAYEVASLIMVLIPLCTPHSLDHSDRQHLVQQIAGLAADAAAIALKVAKPPYEALKFLEIGRGVVTSPLVTIRTDVSNLQQRNSTLAEDFVHFQALLDIPGDARKPVQYHDMSKRFERLIRVIRYEPGFEHFLHVPSEEELSVAGGTNGSIVLINISLYGSHALLIKKGNIQVQQLPLLHKEEVCARIDTLSSLTTELLEWLWFAVADPILKALGYTTTPKNTWPRIWWIPIGPLARFPMHAAGRYSEFDTRDTVLDRVISSYSSSLRTFVHNHQNISYVDSKQEGNMVLVGMTHTPGYSDLAFATKEIEVLTGLGKNMGLQVEQPSSQREEVLSAIGDCTVFHFAGHGTTNPLDPVKSALILSNGRLTVENLFETNLQSRRPFLAYLSACGTSQIKHETLIDESLHLVEACNLAGFQHVIGTLWEVNDESCVRIAEKTYGYMQKQGISHDSVSEGLHFAIRDVRSQWIKENTVRSVLRQEMYADGENKTLSEPQQARSNATKDLRDAESIEDVPLHWAPYIHHGI